MRTKEQFCELMRQRIREENWRDLFTAGGCYFFALVLHEELQLPLFFYTSSHNSNGFGHVFVMRGRECIDYDGKDSIEAFDKRHNCRDQEPQPTNPSEIKMKIKEKGCWEKLEKEIYEIAKKEFYRQREKYV